MRKMRYILTVSAVALLFGCSKSDEDIKLPETQLTVTAGFAENGDTKTTLHDLDVYWEVGDEIKIFYGTGSGRFVSVNEEETAATSFTGSINVAIGGGEGFTGGEYMWGLYPYRSDATYDGTYITTIIPDQQTGKAGSFARNMNISLAKSSNLALAFYNVCGGVRFSVTRDDIKEVVFEGRNNEDIAGRIQVAFSEGVPAIGSLTEGQKKITLTAPGGGAFETGKFYYIVAAPGALSNGFKLTFNTATQYAELVKTNSVTVKRGIFGSLENADSGLTFQTKETPTGNIVFKDVIAKYACVEKFDTNEDNELSYEEAAAVTDISGLFTNYNTVTSFDELKYFTSLSSIGSAMSNLASLKSVTLPMLVTSIPDYAFQSCSALDSISFTGNAINSIGISAFQNCSVLKGFDIPTNVITISNYCFYGCTALESVNLPTGLTSIGSCAFSGCEKLASIDIPSSVNSIGDGAFQNCKSITSVCVPNSVTSFGEYVFSGCSSLESAVLPSGLTSIPNGTFSGCTSLRNFTFPDAVTSIGASAFYGCSFIDQSTTTYTAKFELPSTVSTIGSRALNNVRNVLVTTTSGFVTIQSNTFSFGTRIYVPDDKVEQYKMRTNWSAFASYIYPLSSYSDAPFEMESVNLGLSVKWATCNVGASAPEQYGVYYAWGDVKGQLWNGSWSCGGFSTYPDYELDSNGNLKLGYDAANVNLGGSWRMPTKAEVEELISNCTSSWTSDYNGSGVAGRIFTSKKAGYTDKSIFLPAAGYGSYSDLFSVGSYGYCWSSTFISGFAWCLVFYSDYVSTKYYYRCLGQSVRPVTE